MATATATSTATLVDVPERAPTAAAADTAGSTGPHAPTSPELGANWLSRASWWWLNGLMSRGISTPLDEEDCYALRDELTAKQVGKRFDDEWAREVQHYEHLQAQTSPPTHSGGEGDEEKKKDAASSPETPADADKPAAAAAAKAPGPSLAAVFYRLHKREFYIGGVAKGIADGLGLLQPILLQYLIEFLVDWSYGPLLGQSRPPEWHGIVLSVSLGVCPLLAGLLENAHQQCMTLMGFRIRTALVRAMYRKSLLLSSRARALHSSGKIVNVMSSDTFLLDQFLQYMHLCWSASAMIVVAIALLIRAIGWPAVVGLSVLVVLLPVAGAVMSKWFLLYAAQAPIKDARVKRINEILLCIRVIKLYVWEAAYLDLLLEVRERELTMIRAQQMLNVATTLMWTATPVLISLVAFITLGLTSDAFDPAQVFAALALFNVLRMPLIMAPAAMAQGASAAVALARVQDFLLAEELQWAPRVCAPGELRDEVTGAPLAVRIDDASFEWHTAPPEKKDDTKGEDEVAKKTADEKTKEKEKEKDDKSAAAAAPAAAAAAAAAAGATSDAIPAGSSVAAPAVQSGFKLEHLDVKVAQGSLVCVVGAVGSGKSSLLGALLGEMERTGGAVSMCGSVAYCAQSPVIINASVRDNILFGAAFDQRKYDAAVRFAALTHDLEVLPHGDRTDIGERGINLSGGQRARVSMARALFASCDTLLLDDPLSAVDAHVGHFLFHECVRDFLGGRTRVLVTHQLQFVRHADHVVMMADGRVAEQGSYADLMQREGGQFRALLEKFGGKDDENKSEADAPLSDEEKKAAEAKRLQHHPSTAKAAAESTGADGDASKALEKLMQAEDHAKGGVKLGVYAYYCRAGGGFWPCAGLLAFMALSCAVQTYNSWWLSDWTDDTFGQSQSFYVGIYTAISIGGMVLTAVMMLFCCYISVRASRVLHEKSFARLIRAPTAFFDTTPLGRILNRFSRDQGVIDDAVMRMVQNVLSIVLSLIGILVIIAIVTPWILIPFAVVTLLYVQVERAFRNSSRELKRVESVQRSPLYAHFAETLTGLSTIRAYRVQGVFLQSHLDRLDAANSPTYLQLMAQRWLSIRVETISAVVAFFSAILVVVQRDTISAGQAGVSVSYAISLPLSLNWLVRCTAEVESGMNSVERAKFYSEKLPQEAAATVPEQDRRMQRVEPGVKVPLWSGEGQISFEGVRMRYRTGLPEVLKGVSFTIRPRERVGVVGRTGSGKSSLMVALYRLVELDGEGGGTIRMDGVDISTLGLDFLRQSMAIISQDPVLFAGTVRSNLDPFNTLSDAEVWQALERAHMAVKIRQLPEQLNEPVQDGGENFSLGERASLCLARAMLRKAKVLIMDEATASVDMGTDSLIQLSLRRDFSDRTLLTIAHRLHTIIDYSRVLVMSDGAVAEFDTPARLLRDPQSLFFKMVADTGAANAQLLTHLAFEAERGVDVAAQLLGEGAALAPDALVAGLASPSVLMPTRDEREVSWGGGGGGHADREESQLRWHDHAPPEEEDEAAGSGEGHPAAAVPLIRASGLHF